MRRSREIFSLSFLDIMACSFGAILLIVLISNFSESEEPDLDVLNEYFTFQNVFTYNTLFKDA